MIPAFRRLHVAIVDEELPYPPVTGKRLRTFKLLIRLARRHRLTYICHRRADEGESVRAARVLADHQIETIVVNRAIPPKSGIFFYGRLAANLMSALPYSVAIHRSRALSEAITAYARAHRVDLWHAEWTPYAASLNCLPGAPHVVVAHNIESLIWQRYLDTETRPLYRWYIKRQLHKWLRFERQAFTGADRIVAVSATDRVRMKRQFGAHHVDVIDNGVDTTYFRSMPCPRHERTILFLGSLDWRPNLDAVQLLLNEVFPGILRHEPRARLLIVGRNPPAHLEHRLRRTKGVEHHANVRDVRPYLAESGVMAVPLRIGGGSRLKILEALAMGLPVVSTPVGAEGLNLEAGRHLTIAESMADFTAALLWTMRNPATARAMAQSGRQFVTERYDWSPLADKLERVWLSTAKPVSTWSRRQPGRHTAPEVREAPCLSYT